MGEAWTRAMRRGDFEAAWHVSDAIMAARRPGESCWRLPRHEQWVWDGRPLAGQRVLVRCYHGLGDTLQFARFLPALAELSTALTVWVQPALIDLLRRMPSSFSILPLHDGTPEVDYDVDLEVMELAHALRITTASLPGAVPYFAVDAEPRRCSSMCVGLAARAGDWDSRRSVPPELVASLSEVPAIRTFNLQLDPPLTGSENISTPDVLALASRIRALDLVVTPDTMTAHLAGALGVPTWTLVPAEGDWRWMEDRDDSPWYPTMRLFRQSSPGDWETVIRRVRAALAR